MMGQSVRSGSVLGQPLRDTSQPLLGEVWIDRFATHLRHHLRGALQQCVLHLQPLSLVPGPFSGRARVPVQRSAPTRCRSPRNPRVKGFGTSA